MIRNRSFHRHGPPAKGLGVRASAVLLLVCGLLLGASSTAFGASAWWSMSSNVRPTYLHSGVATDGVQELTVSAEAGDVCVAEPVRLKEIEEGTREVSELICALFPFDATAEEVEAQLQKVAFPFRLLHVSELPSKEEHSRSYQITFPGQTMEAMFASGEFAGEHGGTNLSGAKAEATSTVVSQGKPDGEIVLTAENVGDANAEGSVTPVSITDQLPPGLKAVGISAWKAKPENDPNNQEPVPCVSLTSCMWRGIVPPFETIEERVAVIVEPGSTTGALNRGTVSGGEGSPASVSQPITISELATPFGVQRYSLVNEEEGGAPATQAGAHPFQQTTTLVLNEGEDTDANLLTHKEQTEPAALTRDTSFVWPAGLIGNPSAVPKCELGQFLHDDNGLENDCPEDTAVGVAIVTFDEPALLGATTFTLPLYNLQPATGEPARFGFNVLAGNAPVVIDTAIRSGGDYGVTVSVRNIAETVGFLSAKVTVWGVPGDPIHDSERGWSCIYESHGIKRSPSTPFPPCVPLAERHPAPLLVMPTSCSDERLFSNVEADQWATPDLFQSFPSDPMPTLDGCNRLPFGAAVNVASDGQAASTPTGLNVDVHVPQDVNENGAGLGSSDVKDIRVTFPEGVTVNPAAADGLQACSEAQVGFHGFEEFKTDPGVSNAVFSPKLPEPLEQGVNFCPDASKLGTIKIKSPLLPAGELVEGALYLATPAPNGETGMNPFDSLVAMYIVAEDPISGVLLKLPGEVSLDRSTGRITATFKNNPQLEFEDAEIHLFGGDRAPLSTPATCGAKTTEAAFTPWSGTSPVSSTSTFDITRGPNGTSCPSALPFGPSLTGGTTNINAGSFSPLTTTFTREDGQQNIQTVRLHMPAGLSGILSGVKLCQEADANAGTCGPQSLIGHTIVSVGLGGDPFSVTGGQVFLTEKYQGAPFGLSIVNPAVAGPFNLGKVIVRARIEVDPHTTELTITTGEIPHILEGIPLQIKHVNVTIDRPGFTFNPTNCNKTAITGNIGSVEGASSPVTVPFQVTNCATLKFAPKFVVSTSGKTSKANGASLTVKLTEPNAPFGSQANIGRVKVDLPKQLPSRLTTLQKACTAAQFDTNPAGCPAASIIGHVRVITPLLPVPLEGPAYFVSNGGEAFPNLIMLLQGYGVTVELVGDTFISKAGITSSTFKTIPDVPFNTFELTLPEGKYSALAANLPATANGSFCGQALKMPTELLAQNGLKISQTTPVTTTGCAKKKALTRPQKLAAALKTCHKDKSKAKRASCEHAARKRYGPTAKKKSKKK